MKCMIVHSLALLILGQSFRTVSGQRSFSLAKSSNDNTTVVCAVDSPKNVIRAVDIVGFQFELVPDIVRCAFECTNTPGCVSFNYKLEQLIKFCELYELPSVNCITSDSNNCQYFEVCYSSVVF
jgi:hypothetical protein